MQMIRTVGLLVIAASVASCATVAPKERSLTVRSTSKHNLGTYAFWNSECYARPVSIDTVVAPAHGKLIQTDTKQAIRKTPQTPAVCVGRMVDGLRVFYQPNPGYIGADQFEFKAVSDVSERAFRFTVKVVK